MYSDIIPIFGKKLYSSHYVYKMFYSSWSIEMNNWTPPVWQLVLIYIKVFWGFCLVQHDNRQSLLIIQKKTTLDKLCTITICTLVIKEETALEQLNILLTVHCT